ncbi:PH domain-containing protein [Psychrobium sp. 1_MG-2023]|uniref:PH domain-containing protein n=1 Tax=Psychrobium sp. 1_MG-2023 TaxID=3062624 RepID=UPI000C3278A3|nr:PH domain-containing protein [Psychrobium sp. 1_MG-2023]MDP2561485.1 PH domain-containing protein [Psychrobium sp. 1_MG-2023]PKF57751.1 hypothetical protein CW748_06030 [Alteromonadales bacterium alter-6D02]
MNKWQRVSSIAWLHFFVKNLMLIVNNAIYLIPIIFTSYDKILAYPLWVAAGVAGILSLLLLVAFLQYYFFKYRLNDQNIEIHAGVIFKTHLDLPFTRIQNVKLISPVYFRPFGYTTLELDTAGSAKNEANIVAVARELAEQLKATILSYQQSHQAETEAELMQSETESLEQEQLLNQRSLKDLVIHGITNNRVWIFLAILAPMAETIIDNVIDVGLSLGIDLEELFFGPGHPWWELTLYVVSTIILAYIIVMLLSVIGSIIAFYGYKLTRKDENYIQRSGLLSHHEVVMKLSRLQLIIRQQDWLDVLIKRINLKFEQLNMISHGKQGGLRSKLMVPSVTLEECSELINEVWPLSKLETIDYKPINKRFMFKYIGVIIVPFHLLVIGFFAFNEQYALIPLVLVSGALMSSLVWARWRRWGFNRDENYLYIRKGLLGVDYYCFPINKIQQVKFKQSVLLRRHQLCCVTFVTAASSLTIPFIDQELGWDYLSRSLYQVESSKQNWM